MLLIPHCRWSCRKEPGAPQFTILMQALRFYPNQFLKRLLQAILNFNNTGLSILEIGHRTAIFQAVMDEARALVKELMQLDDDHEVLFLHGGASTQFMQVPMNLLDDKETAAYTDTGVWSTKAIKEAKLFGKVEIVCSSKESNFTYIPKDFAVPNDAKYLHITTNNTIYGTQWQKIPKASNSLVADMSSDIFSRVLDFNAFDLIYAGAQKNMGPAGVNLVVVNKNMLGKVKRAIPTIMDYRNHIKEGIYVEHTSRICSICLYAYLKMAKGTGWCGRYRKTE